jgi:hypothetical protein
LEIKTLNVELLSKLFLGGAKNLEAKKEYINELNVFPVPDGDTGTNMTLTILSAANEVSALSEPDMRSLAKAISSGSLRGARGNSGVILSQLLRGFSKVIAEYDEIDVMVLAEAFTRAVETAYKAVMKPKEGTILTVARCTAERAAELAQTETDITVFAKAVIEQAERTLEKTPDLLPVLKQAGVVDSGGQGLLEMLRGAYDVLCGKEVDYTSEGTASSGIVKISAKTEEEIRFGYCTEFIIVLNNELSAQEVTDFKLFLESIGDSIVVVADEEIVKVHVHTNDPGEAISKALTYGSLSKIKIDNMREEHQEKLIKDAARVAKQQKEEDEAAKAQAAKETVDAPASLAGAPEKEMGFICVSIGDGLNQIFKDLGVDYVIEGGQTMNPSTEDILNAVEQVSAEHVFVLPNNKNIILAANQAAAICEEKHIIVIPTKTVPQGITALINYIPESSVDENTARMTEEIGMVSTGQVTYAVRDTVIDDKEIKQGDFMGIGDSSILSVGKDRDETLFDMLDCMIDDESEIISIYYGADVDEEAAQAASKEAEKRYPDCEIELHYGGQPIYYYVISVE